MGKVGKGRARFIEGLRFIRPQVDPTDLLAVLPNWVGWHEVEKLSDRVLVPTQLITGERVIIELPNSYTLKECEAPSVDEFIAKKQKDYPPSDSNTHWWANQSSAQSGT